jgi:hypothetical protein
MGTETTGGETPPATPSEGTAMGTRSPLADRGNRDGDTERNSEAEENRDGDLSGSSVEKALREERKRNRSLEAEIREFRAAEQQRIDAGKTELQRQTERAELAERTVAQMQREMLARQVAGEAGIPQLWHRLSGDDTRALRADAQRLREEMGLTSGALEGGVRGDSPNAPVSMDELIRGGVRR